MREKFFFDTSCKTCLQLPKPFLKPASDLSTKMRRDDYLPSPTPEKADPFADDDGGSEMDASQCLKTKRCVSFSPSRQLHPFTY